MTWAPEKVQLAVYSRLTSDVALMALVSGVYDHIPQDQAFPFVVIGEDDYIGRDSHTTNGYSVGFRISVWSRGFGRKGCMQVMEAVDALLHNKDFSISGWNILNLRRDLSQIIVDSDSVTYQGIMRYSLLLGET
jgi:hypothetical protein